MLFLFLIVFLFFSQEGIAAQEEKHKKAIDVAREGHTKEALEIMESIGPIDNWEKKKLYDYIIILIWRKDYKKAYSVYKTYIKDQEELPIYIISNLAQLCRDLKKYPEAKKFYKQQLQREKDNVEPYIGLAWILNDEDDFWEVIAFLKNAQHLFPHNAEILRPLAFAYMRVDMYAEALGIYHRILDMLPGDRDAIQGQVKSLMMLGAPYQAQSIVQKYPEWFDEDTKKKIFKDTAVFDVHSGMVEKPPPSDQHLNQSVQKLEQLTHKDDLDHIFKLSHAGLHAEAVKNYEALVSTSKEEIPVYILEVVAGSYLALGNLEKSQEIFSSILQRDPNNEEAKTGMRFTALESEYQEDSLKFIGKQHEGSQKDESLTDAYLDNKFDLIFALNRRGLHAEAVKHYEALISTYKQEIPLYVLEVVAGSYLALRNLEKSGELFSAILEKDPNNEEAVVGKYFTLLESEYLNDSLDFIRKQHERYKKDERNVFDSPYEQQFYQSFFYAGLLERSEKHAKEAVKEAPFNPEFRKLLGDTYLDRGLPRSAQKEFLIGLTNTPQDLGLKISYVNSLMALERNREAEHELALLKQKYPQDESVKTLEKDWTVHNAREFNVSTEIENSRGPIGNEPGRSTEVRTSLYSAPFAYNFRGFIGGRFFTGLFPEGRLNYFSETEGANYRSENLVANLEMRQIQYNRVLSKLA